MSDAFDRFLAGDGRLAQLIGAQPPFDVPEGMFERVLAAIDTGHTSLDFEPPASLEATIMAEAARLDAAQAPRRGALLDQIATGTSASDALGSSVSTSTARWLDTQVRHRTPQRAPKPRSRWQRWSSGLGVAVATALAASVALKVWFDPGAPVQEQAAAPLESDALAVAPPAKEANMAQRDISSATAVPQSITTPHDMPGFVAKARPRAQVGAAVPAPPATPRADREARSPEPNRPATAAAPVKRKAERFEHRARLEAMPAQSASTGSDAGLADSAVAPLAESDSAPVVWEIPLATPAQAIAARMLAQPPRHWVWIVHPADKSRAMEKRDAVLAAFGKIQRPDAIRVLTADRPTGSLLIERPSDPGM